MDCLLAIDQGTTGSTVMVLAADGRVAARANRELPQHFPQSGWVEHDADEIWTSVVEAMGAAMADAGVSGKDVRGIGITNQRETTLVWDRATGKPIHRAIVWQDRRTADACAALKARGLEPTFRETTGLVLDPYFSGTKIAWLLDHVAGSRERAERSLAFGTIDTMLVHRLSGGEAHVTDVSNASRTLLMSLETLDWDPRLCAELGVPLGMLPRVRSSSEVYARTRGVPGLPDGVPIAGIAGDQQAALFGQACFAPGDAKCTYGTGAFLLMTTGATPVRSSHGLITTVAWKIGDRVDYALEGSAFIAGAAVQWLRDGLGIIAKASDVEALARKVDSAGEVTFVPALTGLGAPHWDPHARGLLSGIGRDTTAAHIARATLDGIAWSIVDLCRAMEADMRGDERALARLAVDGGATANDLLMQIQADYLGAPVERPVNVETTAFGAAYLAGLAVGVFPDLAAVSRARSVDRSFAPTLGADERAERMARWQLAVARARFHAPRA
ncbi:MAG: glycerol kinase GlpK [Deltaproteobacteria bacterium]|nr:glycerol kinase GlpK [Deltaproteobacteria bacterium]